MKYILAVHHAADVTRVAAVAFEEWGAGEADKTLESKLAPQPKVAGAPAWERDVAALQELLRAHALQPEALVIEGFVHLDEQDTPGPGRRLFDALGGQVPVIGIAKSAGAFTAEQFEVHREEEAAPVLVTCAGIDLGAAKARGRAVHGRKRLPTLLKLAVRTARGKAD